MFYRPKFCCQCGEKVERIDWKLWSSRRFCELCETEVGHHDWMPRITLGLGLLLSVFGLGTYLQTSENKLDVVPRQLVNQTQIEKNAADKTFESQTKTNEEKIQENLYTTSNVEPPTKQISAETKNVAADENHTKHLEISQNKRDEPVYFCGAQTKKGTPCSRRVKGGGRCWQHKGKNAMLSEEELLASH